MSINSNIKPVLFLFTSGFPYNSSEVFVANELPVLSEKFSKIFLVPNCMPSSNPMENVPDNVEVIDIYSPKCSMLTKLYFFLSNFLIIFHVITLELIHSRQRKLAFSNLKYNFFSLLFMLLKAEKLIPYIKANPGAFYYTYWFSTDSTMLSLLVKKRIITSYISRAHGFDLYENNGKLNYIPFRNFQLKNVHRVFCVSKIGSDYLKNIYPSFSQKIAKSYLGVYKHGINPLPPNNEIVIVSCSNIIKGKRVHLIAEALRSVKLNIKWVHFGCGNLKVELEKNIATLPGNIKVELKGAVDNKELMDFYKHNAVSLFINTSISEGIPVSIMEAISFGIPIFATNVGGVSEIVTPKTGVLVDSDFKVDELSLFLNTFLESKFMSLTFRKKVQIFGEDNFSAIKNYNTFIDDLFHLNNYMTSYRQCKKCVLDSNDDPEIIVDTNGVCNHCHDYDKKELQYVLKGDNASRALAKIVAEIKKHGTGNKYDCIIGVSGGVDSTYLSYQAKLLGLRPLIVHFDNGWNSELAVKNIENIVQKLGFDLFTYVINWEEFKDIQLAYLKASVVDVEAPTDHAISAVLYKIAHEHGIKYLLSGFNIVTEGVLPKSWRWSKSDLLNIESIHKHYGKIKLKTYPKLGFWKGIFYQTIVKLESIQLLNYFDYNKKEVKEIIIKELGWRDYGGKHYESIFTRFYQGYILPNKFKIDKRKAHLSTLICSGQISREQAFEEINEPIYDPKQLIADKEFVLKKLGLSEKEFDLIMNLPIRNHSDFGSYETKHYLYHRRFFEILKPLIFLLKKIKNIFS